MADSKVQPILHMPFSEQWSFFLDNSLYSSFFQVKMNGFWREGVVDDGLKCSSHLNSIIDLAKGDKTHCIVNIDVGNLKWMTTKGFLKVRMVFSLEMVEVETPVIDWI
jgi:hypothetical protein